MFFRKRPKRQNISARPIYLRTQKEEPVDPKRFIKRFVYLFIFALLIFVLFFSSAFKVDKIEVLTDNQKVKNGVLELIKRETSSFWQKNIIILNTGNLKNQILANFSAISGLQIQKVYPNTLKVKISLKTPNFIWQTKDLKYLVNEEGIAFDKVEKEVPEKILTVIDTKGLPIKIGEKIVTRKFVTLVSKIGENFTSLSGLEIKGIEVIDIASEIHIKTPTFVVLFDVRSTFEDQMDRLNLAINEAQKQGKTIREYVNLTIPGRIYFK